MLDKVAGILKKKRKNQRDTLLRVALVRFPLFFYGSPSLAASFTATSSLPISFLYRFPRLHRAVFHFLIEKIRLLSKVAGRSLNDLSYLSRAKIERRAVNPANRQDKKAGEANCSFVVIVGVSLSKGER